MERQHYLKHMAFQVLSQLPQNPQEVVDILNAALNVVHNEFFVEQFENTASNEIGAISGLDRGVIVQFPRRDRSNPG